MDYATDFDVTALDTIDDAVALERRVPIRHPQFECFGDDLVSKRKSPDMPQLRMEAAHPLLGNARPVHRDLIVNRFAVGLCAWA